MNREQFVVGSAAAAVTAVEWFRSRALAAAMSIARPLTAAEIVAGVDETVLALIQTFLPFDHPRFPHVKPEQIRTRLYALFPIRTEPAFQQTTVAFNLLDLFAEPPPAMETAEATLFLAGFSDAQKRLDDAIASDRSQFATYRKSLEQQATTFTSLAPARRQSYLKLWARSRLGIRRRYYSSVKALVMITAYSMDEFWIAIGYPGPLLAQHTAKTAP